MPDGPQAKEVAEENGRKGEGKAKEMNPWGRRLPPEKGKSKASAQAYRPFLP